MRALCVLLLICLAAIYGPRDAFAVSSGVALVIGNAKYPDNDTVVNEVANDTQDVADELKRDGFDVERGLAEKRSGSDGSADIKQAKDMDHTIASEFAGYGVNERAR